MIISVTQPLEDALNQILQLNSGNNRRKMMRKVSGFIAKINRKRIKQNVTPDGKPMVERKGSVGADMSFADYMRLVWKRPAKKHNKGSSNNATPFQIYSSKKIKRRLHRMFIGLRNGEKTTKGMGSVLKQGYEEHNASAYFNGVAGNIALDHQLGRSGVGRKDGQRFNDPMRELLGLPTADQNAIAQMIIDALVGFR